MADQRLRLMPGAETKMYAARAVTSPAPGLDWETVPADLDDAGRDLWVQLAEAFGSAPVRYRESDRAALTALCRWWGVQHAALAELHETGVLVPGRSKDKGRRVKSPAFQVAREASIQCRGWARLLHLDSHDWPLVAAEGDGPWDNPFAG